MKVPTLAEALSAARETRRLELGAGSLRHTGRLFLEAFGPQPAVVVADPNTFKAAGQAVLESLRAAGITLLEPFIFNSPHLYAEYSFVAELQAALQGHTAIPVAVGSGTINDLTKLAASRTQRPYLTVATAASMDGYTAFGASITFEGSKQTFLCPAPAAVVADPEVIRQAPGPMNAWGYADLVAKVTAGADWLLADALGVEPIQPEPWAIVQGRLRQLISDPAGVRANQPLAIERLVEGLMLGGFAMQAAKSSRPASGAEHQFSHLWDMQHHTHEGKTPSHGFKVAIGTLAVTALYERLLARPLETLDVEACCAAWPEPQAWAAKAAQLFGGGNGELARVASQEIAAKAGDQETLRKQLVRLRQSWPELRGRLRAQLLGLDALQAMFQSAGVPTQPEQIGISRQRLRDSFWQAFFIRRRFTVLDLAVRAGCLEPCIEEVFGPGGPWGAAFTPLYAGKDQDSQ